MICTISNRTGFAPVNERWKAIDDSMYDGAPDAGQQRVGHGPTEVAALLDYVAQMIEAEPEHPSHGMGGGLMLEAQIKTCERLAAAVRELAQ